MSDAKKPTRRRLLLAGAVIGGATLSGRTVWAQAKASPTKVLDFQTYADMAKVEQEGQFVFYCHENEAGTAAIVNAFTKDFPKIQGSYVRAQTGALYSKILAERSAGRFDVDVIQLSDLAPAIDFQKKSGYEIYHSPEATAYQAKYLSDPAGPISGPAWTLPASATTTSRRGGGRTEKLEGSARPALAWRDELQDRRLRLAVRPVVRTAQTVRRRLLESFAKQLPHAFDSRVQLMDRLGAWRRQGDVGGRIRGLCAVSEEGRRHRLRRAA